MNLSKKEEARAIRECIELHGAYFTFRSICDGDQVLGYYIYSIEQFNGGKGLYVKVNGSVVGQYGYSDIERAVSFFMELSKS